MRMTQSRQGDVHAALSPSLAGKLPTDGNLARDPWLLKEMHRKESQNLQINCIRFFFFLSKNHNNGGVSGHAGTYAVQVMEAKGHSCHDDGQGTVVSPSVTRGTCRDTQTQQTLTRAADIIHTHQHCCTKGF